MDIKTDIKIISALAEKYSNSDKINFYLEEVVYLLQDLYNENH